MSNAVQIRTPAEHAFLSHVTRMAVGSMKAITGDDKAGRAAGTEIVLAFQAILGRTPQIVDCTPSSVGRAVALTILSGLDPRRDVYIFPRAPFKGAPKEAQWEISPHGLRALAARSGVRAHTVIARKGEEEEAIRTVEALARGEFPIPLPDTRERRYEDVSGGYVVAVSLETGRLVGSPVWVPISEIDKRRSCAQTKKVWEAWPWEMIEKTLLRCGVSRGLIQIDSKAPGIADALEADYEGYTTEPAAPVALPEAQAERVAAVLDGEVSEPDPEAEELAAVIDALESARDDDPGSWEAAGLRGVDLDDLDLDSAIEVLARFDDAVVRGAQP